MRLLGARTIDVAVVLIPNGPVYSIGSWRWCGSDVKSKIVNSKRLEHRNKLREFARRSQASESGARADTPDGDWSARAHKTAIVEAGTETLTIMADTIFAYISDNDRYADYSRLGVC
jgi:hypothetical protein